MTLRPNVLFDSSTRRLFDLAVPKQQQLLDVPFDPLTRRPYEYPTYRPITRMARPSPVNRRDDSSDANGSEAPQQQRRVTRSTTMGARLDEPEATQGKGARLSFVPEDLRELAGYQKIIEMVRSVDDPAARDRGEEIVMEGLARYDALINDYNALTRENEENKDGAQQMQDAWIAQTEVTSAAEAQRDEAIKELEIQRRINEAVITMRPGGGAKHNRLPHPPVFDGEKSEGKVSLEEWIMKVKNKLHADADLYADEEDKLAYVQDRISGSALLHLQPRLREGAADPITEVKGVFELLELVFGEYNKKEVTQAKFRRLYQNQDTFAKFYSEFLRLTAELDMTEESKLFELKARLNDDLRKNVAHLYDVKKVNDFAAACFGLDSELQQIKSRTDRARHRANNVTGGAATNSNPRQNISVGRAGDTGRGGYNGGLVGGRQNTTGAGQASQSGPSFQRQLSPAANADPLRSAPTFNTKRNAQLYKENKCFNCKQVGHQARVCPYPPKERSGGQVNAILPRPEGLTGPAGRIEGEINENDQIDYLPAENYGPLA